MCQNVSSFCGRVKTPLKPDCGVPVRGTGALFQLPITLSTLSTPATDQRSPVQWEACYMAGGGVGVDVGGKRGYSNKALHVHSLCPAQLRPTWWNKHTDDGNCDP